MKRKMIYFFDKVTKIMYKKRTAKEAEVQPDQGSHAALHYSGMLHSQTV